MTKEQFKKKWENYWFYYKIHTIVAIIAVIVLAVLIKQCADRINPDMTVVVVSNNVSMSQAQTDQLEARLSKLTADVNNDGHKLVQVEVLYMNPKQGQMAQAMQQKLQIETAATDDAIYITDATYFKLLSRYKFFASLKNVDKAAPDVTKTPAAKLLPVLKVSGVPFYNELSISIRGFGNSFAQTYKASASYRNAVSVMKKLMKNGGII